VTPSHSAPRSNSAVGSARKTGKSLTDGGRTKRCSSASMASTTRLAVGPGARIGKSAGNRVVTPSNMPVLM
jgi:hypothetical protein